MQSQWMLINNLFAKDGNAMGLQKLVDSCNKPTKNNGGSSVGGFGISNLERFLQEVKCEAHSQPCRSEAKKILVL
jgi:hypothetical protein